MTAAGVRPARVDSRPLKILIHRTGSLGDTLVAIPALRLIAAAFPNARRILLCNAPVSSVAAAQPAVLEGLGLIDEALTYRSAGALATARAIFRAVRAARPDVVVSLLSRDDAGIALRDHLMFKACGVPRVIGLGLRGRRLREIAGGVHEREAVRLARLIAELGEVDWDDAAAWSAAPGAADRAGVERKLPGWRWQPDYFCVALGTKAPSNDWGQDRWNEMITLLARSAPPLRLVCVGAAEDQPRAEQLLRHWPHGGESLCGRLSVRETAAVLAGARLLAGHDSGPMHLAAAVGTPTLAVFSRRNPMGKWFALGPRHVQIYSEVPCAGCGLVVCTARANLCTRQIGAAEVAARMGEILSGARHPGDIITA